MIKKSGASNSSVDRLNEISTWVASVLNVDELLEHIVHAATATMQARASSLLLLDKKREKLHFQVATGEKREEVRKYMIDVGEGIAGWVARTGEPILIPDVNKDPRWHREISEAVGFETRSIACAPMKMNGEVIGVVEIIDRNDGGALKQDDLATLIAFADLMHAIRNAPLLNIELSGEVRVRFPDMVERIAQSVQGLSASLRKQVETRPNLDLYWGTARFVADKTICVNQDRLSADRIFIASGSRPSLLPIDGLDKTPYMTSTEALLNRQLPSTMIVLGAGYVACELGHAYESFGTKTSFIVRSELLRGMDRDVKSEFRRVFSRRHRLYEQVVPLRALYEGGVFKILVEAPATGKRTELESEALLVAAGRVPDTQDLGLENTSIETTDGGFIRVNDRLQTRVEGVYALGDCVGRYFSRHSANFEGEYLLRTLFEAPSDEPIRYGPMPYAIFAVPEAAGLGKTEDALEREGVDCVAGFSTYADSNMGMARRLDYGFAKILVAPRNKALLGAHIVGPEASDMIHMLIALMYKGGDLDDLLKMVYIHPALPEVVRDAARDAKAKLK